MKYSQREVNRKHRVKIKKMKAKEASAKASEAKSK